MKRMRIVGLCLVAVFALSAVIAASASAAAPEFQVCGKAAKAGKLYTGKYTDKACSKEASPTEITEGKKNKYEREEWSKAKKKGFKGKNKGTPHNQIVNPFGECNPETEKCETKPAKVEGETECTKEAVVGEVTGPKTETFKTIYTGCSAGEFGACHTAGASEKKAEIKTNGLEGELVFLNAAKTEVGLRVKGLGGGGELAQYECAEGLLKVNVFGEVLAKVKGNTDSANKKTVTAVEHGALKMQSQMYIEESHSEEEGKKYFEYGFKFQACVAKLEAELHLSKAEAEAACKGALGAEPAKPISLVSVISGAKTATAPAVQNGETESKGEAFLIST